MNKVSSYRRGCMLGSSTLATGGFLRAIDCSLASSVRAVLVSARALSAVCFCLQMRSGDRHSRRSPRVERVAKDACLPSEL